MKKKRLAILISGRGSNMAAVVDWLHERQLPVELVLVASNRPEAEGLALARARGLPTQVVDHAGYPDRLAYDQAMAQTLNAVQPDLILMAGYMRIVTPWFCEPFTGRLLNIHPSLLPAYSGLRTHARALADGVKVHGATVHAVTADLDQGPILAQAVIPVYPQDDAQGLADRLLPLEHALYPQAAAAVLSGLARLTPQGWQFDGPMAPGFETLRFSQRLLHRELAGDLVHG
ncbi:MAG: phosphoribosylglycinamide formyltransferase [Burkholderiaceae bacterium]